jgi:hypothetical protein
MENRVNQSAPQDHHRFLADLTRAMRLTAQAAQQDALDVCHAEAQARIEELKASIETGAVKEAAEKDVVTIREQSREDVERVRAETEQRVARRRELLSQELAEYDAAIELEAERVTALVGAYQAELDRYFDKLLAGDDPAVFAGMASQMPEPPDFAELDAATLAAELHARREQLARAEGPGASEPAPPE